MNRHQIVVETGGFRCACGEGPWSTSYAWACHAVGFDARTLAQVLIDNAEPLLAPLEVTAPEAPDSQRVDVPLGRLRRLRDAIDMTRALVRAPPD